LGNTQGKEEGKNVEAPEVDRREESPQEAARHARKKKIGDNPHERVLEGTRHVRTHKFVDIVGLVLLEGQVTKTSLFLALNNFNNLHHPRKGLIPPVPFAF